MRRAARPAAYAAIAAGLIAAQGCSGGSGPGQQASPAGSGQPQPTAAAGLPASAPPPGPRICGQPVLRSPFRYDGPAVTSARSGAYRGLPTFGARGTDFPAAQRVVVVPAGDNTGPAGAGSFGASRTVYYFEPGRHVLQGMATGDQSGYVGGYTRVAGATVLDGVNGAGGSKLSYSQSGVTDARQTWEYLTIRNFTSAQNDAVLGDESGAEFDNGNTYKFNTIGPNEYGYSGGPTPRTGKSNGGGYAIGFGGQTTIEYNCLTQNAQGAFNGSGAGIVISHNEISRNGLGEYPDNGGPGASPYGCGCSGGGKLFYTVNPVITYNYVHDNYNAGIWLDFDNTGADISHNYIASNWGNGIIYEASYNASISANTLIGNGWASDGRWPAGVHGKDCYGNVSCTGGLGPVTGAGGGLPYSAIYLPNSGGNASLRRVTAPQCSSHCVFTSRYAGKLIVQHNLLLNNFGGVSVYTDTNRFPGNIDDDSACSVPLGALNNSASATYYQQSRELMTGADARVSGTSVSTGGGTRTLCSDYGASQRSEGSGGQQADSTQAPAPGMAVFNLNTGALVGIVASVRSAHAFTLRSPAGGASGASLLLSAFGGCGPADYYKGGHGVKSGRPAAYYWDNCVWGSRNVVVSGNTFEMQAFRVTGCTTGNMCGFMQTMAFNAGVPDLMQYFQSYPDLIARGSGGLGNVWQHNSYTWSGSGADGTWHFMAGLQGTQVQYSQWKSAPYGQDAGSTLRG